VVELPDGDVVEVAWVARGRAPDDDPTRPTALLLHGLTGSVDSAHVRGLLSALTAAGWRAGCFHFRGCGRGPNRTATGYHSGQSGDPRHVLQRLRARWPRAPLAAIGFSLGANVLLKLLGEDGEAAPVDLAVAVSPPLVLNLCADRMERGLSRGYQRHLVRKLVEYVRAKPAAMAAVDPTALARVRTFRDFDDLVTAPLHGFASADDYYRRCSSRPFLPHVAVPTLVIHALDDPFFQPEVVPRPDELPPPVRFELSRRGGHVGFVEGKGRYYVDRRVPKWLSAVSGQRSAC